MNSYLTIHDQVVPKSVNANPGLKAIQLLRTIYMYFLSETVAIDSAKSQMVK